MNKERLSEDLIADMLNGANLPTIKGVQNLLKSIIEFTGCTYTFIDCGSIRAECGGGILFRFLVEGELYKIAKQGPTYRKFI